MTAVASLAPALLQELGELAREAAAVGGRLLAAADPRDRTVTATKSSPTDVVTATDQAVERAVRELLEQRRPDDGLHGEEEADRPGTSGVTWVIDPVDGTVNFLYGLPAYAVSVAAVVGDPRRPGHWWPVAGCVTSPPAGRTWWAVAGGGAWADGRRLAPRVPPPLEGALVGTGFGYLAQRRAGQARVLASLLPQVRDLRRIGSSAMDLCLVAEGRLDAYYERGVHAWDVAAGRLVLQEAGGTLRGIGDTPPSEEMVVAGFEPLVSRLADRLGELDAARDG